jgi:hypothetical protein
MCLRGIRGNGAGMKRTRLKQKTALKAKKGLNRVSKSAKKQAEKKADGLWAQAIKKRVGEWCMVCGKNRASQSHHIFSRKIKHMRHSLENGIALCAGCHTLNARCSAHGNPEAFRTFLIDMMGEKEYERLFMLSQLIKQPYDPYMNVIRLEAYLEDK